MQVDRYVYLDNNATTRVDDAVVQYMNTFFTSDYAIASSQFSHSPGIRAKKAIDNARNIIAQRINAQENEIVFTSGATESNNLAIKGVVEANESNRNKIIISSIEHFSVLHTVQSLKKDYEIIEIPVDGEGFVDLAHLSSVIDDKTLLVSVILGNHEVGTIQDIKRIAEIAHKHGVYFHTDAAAAFLQVPIDVQANGIDLMSISAHKIHGPKGVGALYVKKGTKIKKILYGGYNEFDLRPGTENVAGIVGFGKAVEVFSEEDITYTQEIRDYLYSQIKNNIEDIQLNGSSDFSKRLPNNLNITFDYIEGESVVLHMDMRGVAVITGSACFSRSLQASHILLAMGFSHERAHGSIRFSPSKYTTKDDIDYVVKHLIEVVKKLRELSPLAQK